MDIKSVIITHTDNIDLRLYQSGEHICDPEHRFGPAVRRHYLYHHILKGNGIYISPHGHFELTPEKGFFIFPGETTVYSADSKDPWHYIWLEFDGRDMEKLLGQGGITREHPVFYPSSEEQHCKIRDSITAIHQYPMDQPLGLMGYGFQFLDALLAKKAMPAKESRIENRHLQQAVEMIRMRFHETLQVWEVADYVGIDRSYLGRLFQQELGVCPRAYIEGVRMAHAVQLLKLRDVNIQTVANSVGYPDMFHFSRVFKKTHGISPGRWRKEHQSEIL